MQRSIQGYRGIYTFGLTALLLSFAVSAPARTNLPQSSKILEIAGEQRNHLIHYFKELDDLSNPTLDNETSEILRNVLGIVYDSPCSEMISHWGEMAKGTARLGIHILFIAGERHALKKYVLLGIRCYSTHTEYRDRYCDERLAVLLIEPQNASITLLPHAQDCTNCSELSRIKFEQIVHKRDPLILSLSIATTNDNPCCGGPYQYSDEKLFYYAVLETGVKQVASVVRYQAEQSYDAVEGDYSKVYTAKIENEPDPQESSVRIRAEYTTRINGIEKENGRESYFWNPDKEKFESNEE